MNVVNEQTVEWATNAPTDWPAIVTGPLPAPAARTDPDQALNELFFVAAFQEKLREAGSAFEVAELSKTLLTPEGMLRICFALKDREISVPVLLYAVADEAAGAHFARARVALAERGAPEPIYYAPAPLPASSPAGRLAPLEFALGTFDVVGKAPPGEYAMWYAVEGEPLFEQSPTLEYLKRIYQACAGYQSIFLGIILRSLELTDGEKPTRISLPNELLTVGIRGPEGVPIVLSAVEEKGVRFHFHCDTPPVYRDAFWKLYAEFCENVRREIAKAGAPRDAAPDQTLTWFEALAGFTRQNAAKGEPSERIGRIEIGG
jgi:hypothetical protein